ncbi:MULTISPECIES: hypothetical protein [unclassified Mitsuokella]|uniref:hypothetical protein n=2 Tax=Mitsuokella TaxID=52225 RepID=UPI000E46D04E|nr:MULTISPECIES: hypothetical protein [unclassified Mitsuokella]RGS72241.1 hypothetical protein DWX75_06860 [Mitsuokella sp. AF21-1AC]RHM53435.1 hypothetical protein DWZ54_10825 [Mitsuokella sp. AF33-22]
MYTKDMLVTKIKMIALSKIRGIEDSVMSNPMVYRRDTRAYCEAMYDVISNMSFAQLKRIVIPIYENYAEMGMADDGYVADSLMMIALALYQNEIGEENIYDQGWTSYVEDFFRLATA